MAILLREEGLLERTIIYATDINPRSLDKAKQGIFSMENVRAYTANYQQAGGQRSFADYYTAAYGYAIFDKSLCENVTFADHSLATDSVFSETQLISCRNVLIYFNKKLQDRAFGLFHESLCHRGFLVLGSKETLDFPATRISSSRWSNKNGSTANYERCLGFASCRGHRGRRFGWWGRGPADPARAAAPRLCAANHCRVAPAGRAPQPVGRVFARRLMLPVEEATDKQDIAPGTVYFATPGYHLSVEQDRSLSLSLEDRVHHSRPAIDYLFESAADAYGATLAAVLLTGANHDGARGLAQVKRRGGLTIVQDPQDAQVATMPLAALKVQQPDHVLPIHGIGRLLVELERIAC